MRGCRIGGRFVKPHFTGIRVVHQNEVCTICYSKRIRVLEIKRNCSVETKCCCLTEPKMEHRQAFRFHMPSRLMMAGPSGSRKTVLTTKLLLELFADPPQDVHYCYRSWQKGFNKLKKVALPKWFPEGGVLVLDDLMDKAENSSRPFPTRWQDVLETFPKVMYRPFGYMLLDLHPTSHDNQRISSHLLKEEGCMRCHQFKT